MNYYWVNIGKSYKEVLNDNFLWAPQPYRNEKNRLISNAGWKAIPDIEQGDIIFCNRDQTLLAVVVANENAISSDRPESRSFDSWKKEGFKVNVDVLPLREQIDTRTFRDEFFDNFNDECIPKLMNSERTFCEQYSVLLSKNAGEMLMSLTGGDNSSIRNASDMLDPDKTYPYNAGTSWTILSQNTAYKKVDKTLVKENSTGIPQEIIKFFTKNDFNINQSVDLQLRINNRDIDVALQRKNDGRHRLSLLSVKSQLKLPRLTINEDTLWFERDLNNKNQFYAYTRSTNPKITTPLRKKPNKPGKRSTQTNGSSRVGQDYFKYEVSEICLGKCIVTGVSDQVPSILIGSHIKSWKESNDDEKIDGHNGLLLAPHVDKLFDKHLISFSEKGKLLVSDKLGKDVLQAWGINTDKVYPLTEKQIKYMLFHRNKFNTELG